MKKDIRLLRRLLSVFVGLLVAAACTSSSNGSALPELVPPQEANLSMRLTADLRGAIQADYRSEATTVRRVTMLSRQMSLYSLLPEPLQVAPGVTVSVAFDLFEYKGDGDFTIDPTPLEAGEFAGGSGVFITVMREGGESEEFRPVVQPCTGRIRSGGGAGHLLCQELSGRQGGRWVALDLQWESQ